MPKMYQPPAGRIPTNRRAFHEVVRDLRYAVFSVVRNRPLGGNQFQATALGSGFFVAPELFLTANHVLNDPQTPHQDGDYYLLVRNEGPQVTVHAIANASLNDQVHCVAECDLALLVARGIGQQAYVSLDYDDWPVGKEIGVAGYPIPRLRAENNQLVYDGLLFRVAKGVATSTYISNLQTEAGQQMPGSFVVEVNFLFVPGNSGGPVFDAETGRVGGFVHGFTTTKVRERVEQAHPSVAQNLPAGVNPAYIENLNALYSLALRLGPSRAHLERLGAKL